MPVPCDSPIKMDHPKMGKSSSTINSISTDISPPMATGKEMKINTGRWTKREHELFLEGLNLYGKDWKKVQHHVGTRTST